MSSVTQSYCIITTNNQLYVILTRDVDSSRVAVIGLIDEENFNMLYTKFMWCEIF